MWSTPTQGRLGSVWETATRSPTYEFSDLGRESRLLSFLTEMRVRTGSTWQGYTEEEMYYVGKATVTVSG